MGTKSKLNSKQLLFVKEYLVDKNATRAAKAAGYSAKTAYSIGQENLNKPDIKKLIQESLKIQSDKLEITAERVIRRIADIAFKTKKVKDSDVLKACELLGKHFNIFTERVEMTAGSNTQMILRIYKNGTEAPNEGKGK